jgi:hypothetical protein
MGTWSTFHYTLKSGESGNYWWSWNDPNGGPSFGEPREFTGSTRNNLLVVTAYATLRGNDNNMNYYIWITNKGPSTASFEIMGGF